jgi:transcriptional/translational regulatory protein YebC/TACO1
LEFIFDRKGVFTIPMEVFEGRDTEELEMDLIDGGAEEVEKDDEWFTIYTSFEDFGNMQKKLEELNIEAESQELQRIPKTTQALSLEDGRKVLKIISKFEEDDDVNNVFHNLEISEELEAEMD